MNAKPAIIGESKDFPEAIRTLYRTYEGIYGQDPFVSPVLRLSLDIGRMLQDGDVSLDDLGQAIEDLKLDGLKTRARHLAAYLGSCAEEENRKILETLFRDLAQEGGALAPFATFQRRTGHLFYGFVFTAHPTFTMAPEQAAALSGYAARLAGAEDGGSFESLRNAVGLPFTPPDIDDETAFSLQAIDNLHGAFAAMFKVLYQVAAELYPDDWMQLRPRLCSIATWVGFDMDGRKDIQWATTLQKRIGLQVRQLQAYQDSFSALMKASDQAKGLQSALEDVSRTLEQMQEHYSFFAAYN